MILQRRISSERVLWGYQPCHRKGWTMLASMAVCTVLVILMRQAAFDAFGWQNAAELPYQFLLPAIAFCLLAPRTYCFLVGQIFATPPGKMANACSLSAITSATASKGCGCAAVWHCIEMRTT